MVETQDFASLYPRKFLPFHNLLPVFLPVRGRHAQEIDTGTQVRDIDAGWAVRHCLRADQLTVNIEHLDSPHSELYIVHCTLYIENVLHRVRPDLEGLRLALLDTETTIIYKIAVTVPARRRPIGINGSARHMHVYAVLFAESIAEYDERILAKASQIRKSFLKIVRTAEGTALQRGPL